jgi:predicted phosphodiesterase
MKTDDKKWKRIVVFSDVHVPFHDVKAFNLLLKFCRWYKPEIVVINGDFVDCHDVSKFSSSPDEHVGLKNEIETAKGLLHEIVSATPGAVRYYIFGNHSSRLQKYVLRSAPEIWDLISLEDLLGLTRNFIIVNESMVENYVQIMDLYIGHWNRVSKHSSYTIKNIMDDRGVNCVQGHVHRLGYHVKTLLDRTIEGWECGCLCSRNMSYIVAANWQLGFLVVEPSNSGKHKTVTMIRIQDDRGEYYFSFGTKLFSTRE